MVRDQLLAQNYIAQRGAGSKCHYPESLENVIGQFYDDYPKIDVIALPTVKGKDIRAIAVCKSGEYSKEFLIEFVERMNKWKVNPAWWFEVWIVKKKKIGKKKWKYEFEIIENFGEEA